MLPHFIYSTDIAKPSKAKIASGFISVTETPNQQCIPLSQMDLWTHYLSWRVEDSIVYKNNEDSDDARMVLSNASDIINGDVGGEVKPNDIVADDVCNVT